MEELPLSHTHLPAEVTTYTTSTAWPLPWVAISGITRDNARSVIATGADLIAVIRGVFDAHDPTAAASSYLSCFEDHTHES